MEARTARGAWSPDAWTRTSHVRTSVLTQKKGSQASSMAKSPTVWRTPPAKAPPPKYESDVDSAL